LRVVLTSALYFPNVGGVENSLRHLAVELRGLGYRPWVLTSSGGLGSRQEPPLTCTRIDGIPVLRYRFSSLFPIRLFRAWVAARTLTRRTGASRAIARDHAGSVAVAAAGLSGVYLVPGIVADQHRPSGFNVLRWLNHFASVLGQRVAFRTIDRVAVFSTFMESSVRASGGPEDIQMVRPGVDPSRFHPGSIQHAAAARGELGVPEQARVAISVGRLSAQKRFDLLVHSMASFSEDWHLVLVGDGPQEAMLQDLAVKLGIGDRVHFVGRTPEPERYLGCADVFVLSSDYEPFGQVIIEAMACGLPVAAFDPSIPEVNTATREIVPEEWLFLASRLDSSDLAGAIEDAVSIPVQRHEIAEWTTAHFSWRKLAMDLLQMTGESASRNVGGSP
jgi:1,2-diacylglycerol 3-alpha-glucosyltransferase